MAKKAKKQHTSKGVKLKIVNPDAAGIDIADSEIQVCVPIDRDGENNRRFGSFTCDLEEICKWLKACNIRTVAMEATGIYWIPLFLMLKENGFDAVLVNAREVKNISDKKTDESDAEWLMLLHCYGLLKASFQPDNHAREIRNLSRHRSMLIRESSKAVLHMQKAMEQMNIKLTNVISDILGKSGIQIIRAILAGERDPYQLASLADARCKSSREQIAKSLEGTWRNDHLFELKQSVERYDFIMGQVKDCETEIQKLMLQYMASIEGNVDGIERSKKHINKKNAINFDVESYAADIWKVNLMQIPGISENALLQLIGELGHDFTEKFDSILQFCKWCNLVPNTKISGGKIISSRVPRKKNPVGQILRVCANTLKSAKNEMGNYFRRMKSRGGYNYAVVATAHKLAKIIYMMVKNKLKYDATKVGPDEKEVLARKIEKLNRQIDKLNQKANDLEEKAA